MVGTLVVTFCDRGHEGPARWLEVWSFPDGSLNLVIASSDATVSEEYVFPCAAHTLAAAAAGCDYQVSGPSGWVFLRAEGNRMCAEFRRHEDNRGWIQCIPLAEFREAIEAVQPHGAYVA